MAKWTKSSIFAVITHVQSSYAKEMAKNLFKLLRIDENSIDNYGDVFIVYANKPCHLIEELGVASFRYDECEDTVLFLYPQDESVIEPINEIGKSGKAWEPDLSEFREGGLRFPDGRRVAYYHKSLVPFNKRALMVYLPLEVSYDQMTWNNLAGDKEWGDEWEFSLSEIRTPYGDFDIEGFIDVKQNGLVGIQLDVFGSLELSGLPGYAGEEEDVEIRAVAIVRQPYNAWLWLHMFDDHFNHVASFSGTEKEMDGFAHYVSKLKKGV